VRILQPQQVSSYRTHVVELDNPNTCELHIIEETPVTPDAADAVIDDPDVYALPALVFQQRRKLTADFIVGKNIGFKVDPLARGGDAFEHPLVRGRSVD
jgi:hypothetical protein